MVKKWQSQKGNTYNLLEKIVSDFKNSGKGSCWQIKSREILTACVWRLRGTCTSMCLHLTHTYTETHTKTTAPTHHLHYWHTPYMDTHTPLAAYTGTPCVWLTQPDGGGDLAAALSTLHTSFSHREAFPLTTAHTPSLCSFCFSPCLSLFLFITQMIPVRQLVEVLNCSYWCL